MKWLRRWSAPDRPETVIGEGAEIRGHIASKGPVHIDGRLEGDARSDDHLVVGPHGSIRGNLHGRLVSIGGRVQGGRVDGTEKVTLLRGGHVTGDIFAPIVIMEEGALFEGESHMGPPKAPPAPAFPPAPRPASTPSRRGSGSASF